MVLFNDRIVHLKKMWQLLGDMFFFLKMKYEINHSIACLSLNSNIKFLINKAKFLIISFKYFKLNRKLDNVTV